jgi:hypothetical protein
MHLFIRRCFALHSRRVRSQCFAIALARFALETSALPASQSHDLALHSRRVRSQCFAIALSRFHSRRLRSQCFAIALSRLHSIRFALPVLRLVGRYFLAPTSWFIFRDWAIFANWFMGLGSSQVSSVITACMYINFATRPVQPVWCEAPSPAPLSPWKYS